MRMSFYPLGRGRGIFHMGDLFPALWKQRKVRVFLHLLFLSNFNSKWSQCLCGISWAPTMAVLWIRSGKVRLGSSSIWSESGSNSIDSQFPLFLGRIPDRSEIMPLPVVLEILDFFNVQISVFFSHFTCQHRIYSFASFTSCLSLSSWWMIACNMNWPEICIHLSQLSCISQLLNTCTDCFMLFLH